MKSLKITLLLAVICVAFMGVTYSNDSDKKAQTEKIYDLNDDRHDVVIEGKETKPPGQES